MAIDVVEYGSDWEKLGGTRLIMQHSFFNPHDFAVTPNHYIFFQVPPGDYALSCNAADLMKLPPAAFLHVQYGLVHASCIV